MKEFRTIALVLAHLLCVSIWGQYNPTNPAEPGTAPWTLTLTSDPSDAGSFNISKVTKRAAGATISITANNNGNYKFKVWEDEDGNILATEKTFKYTMPAKNVKLVARYTYNPSNPNEPSVPVKYGAVKLSVSPSDGGSVSPSGSNKYAVGSKVTLYAYNNSNFVFVNWTKDGEVISTSSTLDNYVVGEGTATLVANFKYAPGNPAEPEAAILSHPLYLESNPSGGGSFNISSGNTYKTGESIYLYAYSNSYYTFKNWTQDNEVISTSRNFYYTMPDKAAKLVANYTYNYNPSNPGEPAATTTQRYHLYGMHEDGIPGQNLKYPVYLENSTEVTGFSIDLAFPEGVIVDATNASLTDRTSGHTLQVESLENNSYRFFVRGSENITGANGKVLEIPISIAITEEIGTTYTVGLSKGAIFKSDGSQTVITARSGSLKIVQSPDVIPDSPDLIVSDINILETSIAPNETLHLSWKVRNIGNLEAFSGWSERLYLVSTDGKKVSIGSTYYETTSLEPDGTVSREADIALGKLLGIEGNTYVSITIIPNASAGEITECQGNNTTDNKGKTLAVKKMLYLTLPAATLTEGETTTAKCQLARSGNWTATEVFDLSVLTGDTRLKVPATVSIPKEQASVYFYLTVENNEVLDNDSHFVIQASGNGYEAVTGDITIEDDELPAIITTVSKSTISEGEAFQLTVTIPRQSDTDVAIGLRAEYPKRFSLPASVTIPAGETSATVTVTAVDDDLPSLELSNAFTASAAGYTEGQAIVILSDDDIPALEMTLTPNQVSESAGVASVAGILRRTGKIDNKITVKLSDNANGGLYFGNRTLELAKGVEEIHFNFGPVDNANVDGDRKYTVTAAVWVSSCNCSASGESAGSVSAELDVFDDDGSTLSLTSSVSTVKEGGKTTLTISRNTATDKALTVTLSSDFDDNLTYDHTLTIPVGQKSGSVEVTSKANDISGDSHTVVFTVAADGYSSGTCYLMITDQTLPDARISNITASADEAVVGENVTLTIVVNNDGAAELPAEVGVKIYHRGESSAITTLYTSEAIAVGGSQQLSKTIALPSAVGSQKYYAVINETHQVGELSYTNNTSAEAVVQTVSPFSVSISTDKSIYQQGDKVLISGQLTGKGTAETTIDLYLINEGARQVVNVTTDSQGAFTYEWELYALQSGHFIVGACYPDEGKTAEMASFDVYGLKLKSEGFITCETKLGELYEGVISIMNPGLLPQTIKSLKVISKPNGCDVKLNAPESVAANETFLLRYSLLGEIVTSSKDWEKIEISVVTNEGVELPVTLYYFCAAEHAILTTNTNSINTTMTKGESREYLLNVMNTGKGSTGKITVMIPNVEWMKLGSSAEIPALEYGETATISLYLKPTSEMPLNVPQTGSISVNCENGNGVSVKYSIEPVSESTGTLCVDVVDEYTYYTESKPHLAGANVVIKHPITGVIVTQGKTDSDGIFSAILPEGYYNMTVSEDHHTTVTGNVLIDPGTINKQEIFLSYTAISYSWDVVETEVEDEYKIESVVTYETNVPKPVVVVNIPTEKPADNSVIAVIVTNKGLINAQHVSLELDCTEGYSLDILNPEQLELLAPQQSYVFYARFKKTNPSTARRKAWGNPNADCVSIFAGAFYDYICNGLKFGEALAQNGWGSCVGEGSSDGHNNRNRIVPVPHTGPSWPSGPSGSVDYYSIGPSSDSQGVLQTLKQVYCSMPCGKELTQSLACEGVGRIVPDWLSCSYNLSNQMFHGDLIGRIGAMLDCSGLPNPFDDGCWGASLDCLLNYLNNRVHHARIRKASSENSTYNVVTNFSKTNELIKKEAYAYWRIALEHFGNAEWLECNNQELANILYYVAQNKTNDRIFSMNDFISLKPQSVSDRVMEEFVERINNTFKIEQSDLEGVSNYINPDTLDYYSNIILQCENEAKQKGWDNVGSMHTAAYTSFDEYFSGGSNSVCASVKLEISQKMVMTRQAFRGTLTVFNGNETLPINDMKLTLDVTSSTGQVATAHEFQINAESLDGFTGELDLTSGWKLEANSTGTATILFIPTKYAAPTEPVDYSFGGTLSYVDPFTGLEVTRELYPVTLTVKPSPELDLTYFMQRDIYGDDALTLDVVESIVPAEFALLINNKGNGDATNVRMVTQQPEIVENEKGLYVDFEIVSSQVNGGDANLAFGKSIANDFGTIPAHSQAYAQWWLTSTLLGHFTEYDVQANHLTSYGNEDLSLLGDVTIHELIHSLDLSDDGNKMVGFLVNDIIDSEDLPDMLYLSNGEVENVSVAASTQIAKTSITDYRMTVVPSASGWTYGYLEDPTLGMSTLKKVVRQSDGKEINLRNFWQTDRTLRDGHDPLYEYKIHFADKLESQSAETYILTFDPLPSKVLKVEALGGIPEEGTVAIEPVDNITVQFNKKIQKETFTADDLTFAVQGKKQDTSLIGISTTDSETFTLDLSQLNEQCGNGYYTMTVQTADITDTEGFQGKVGKQAGWIMFRGGLVQLLTSAWPEQSGEITRKPVSTGARTRSGDAQDDNTAEYGSTVILQATPNTGYEFSNWTMNGEVVSTDPEFETKAIGDMDIVANFTKKSYMVNIENASDGGSVTGMGTGLYEYKTRMELKAVADEDYTFKRWMVNGTPVEGGNSVLSIDIDKALDIRAEFTREYFRQTMTMARGWNWISSYLSDPLKVDNLSTYVNRIVGQTEELVNDPEYGLVGNISELEVGKTYKIEAARVFTNTFRGHLFDVTASPISVHQGWTWMAYPYQVQATVDGIIANAEEGDYIVSQTGFCEYADGSWEGTLDTFTPGDGYLYKSISQKTLAFNEPGHGQGTSVRMKAVRHNETGVDIHRYPNTMNITAHLFRDGMEVTSDDYCIYAFADQELRGVSQQVNQNHYLTVYGDKAVDINFIAENARTGETFTVAETLTFRSETVGSRKCPFTISIGDPTGIDQISGSGPMTVYNLQGILISREATQKILRQLPQGVYIVNGRKCYIK